MYSAHIMVAEKCFTWWLRLAFRVCNVGRSGLSLYTAIKAKSWAAKSRTSSLLLCVKPWNNTYSLIHILYLLSLFYTKICQERSFSFSKIWNQTSCIRCMKYKKDKKKDSLSFFLPLSNQIACSTVWTCILVPQQPTPPYSKLLDCLIKVKQQLIWYLHKLLWTNGSGLERVVYKTLLNLEIRRE